MKHLTVATRGGALAIAQTKSVIAALEEIHPGLRIEIMQVTTSGDSDRKTALWKLKDTGFFTSQIEEVLACGQADFAVHSFKDLPTTTREGLTIAAVYDRKYVEDCIIAREPLSSIEQLAQGAKIGTSSPRRIAQLKHKRPDLQTIQIRGNVKTRIKKLFEGDLDAIMLARAGLERLGLAEKASLIFLPGDFIPAPAQGALAVQARADDKETCEILKVLDDGATRTATFAERKILTELRCGCHAPVGAYARITEGIITIDAFISDIQGQKFIRKTISGPVDKAEALAVEIACQLLDSGGREILNHKSTD